MVNTEILIDETMLCHMLIGAPASGKSTFALQLAEVVKNAQIHSTDSIRAQLYGDESIQGEWKMIEQTLIEQFSQAMMKQCSVIYDATNARRPWRMDLLNKVKALYPQVRWIGWHVKTEVEVCKVRNARRMRQVPDLVMENMHQMLKDFPPIAAEGFVRIVEFCAKEKHGKGYEEISLTQIAEEINAYQRATSGRSNRTRKFQWHRYSQLIDFDRLMHLMSLLIEYPGVGNLHCEDPASLVKLIGQEQTFDSPADEIAAVLARRIHPIYANQAALIGDLEWLDANGFTSWTNLEDQLVLLPFEGDIFTITPHTYSDSELFERLLLTIRFILRNPFYQIESQGAQASLVNALGRNWEGSGETEKGNKRQPGNLRKDIENVLNPYKILPGGVVSMRNGYFMGTGILSKSELLQIGRILESRPPNDDPADIEVYQRFQSRLRTLQSDRVGTHRVRVIRNRLIVDSKYLPSEALARPENLGHLEKAIEDAQLILVNRFGGQRFPQERHTMKIWPLQLVFYNIAWYLGYESAETGVFGFERLDRLEAKFQPTCRKQDSHLKAIRRLEQLYNASFGIYLGRSVEEQGIYVGKNSSLRADLEIQVEVHFTDSLYRFISEGTQRFQKMQMSPAPDGTVVSRNPKIYCLPQANEPQFPNVLRFTVPAWSLQDIELLRWILAYGNQVKVCAPRELVELVRSSLVDPSLYKD
jgi:predicted kinase